MRDKRLLKKLLTVFFIPIGIFLSYFSRNLSGLVEEAYSMGFFRFVAGLMSTVAGIFPFSVAELIVVSLILFISFRVLRLIYRLIKQREGRQLLLLNFAVNAIAFTSIVYFLFVIIWGLNYQRLTFAKLSGLEVKPSSVEELATLCDNLIERANEQRSAVAVDSNLVMRMNSSTSEMFERVYKGYDKAASIYPELGGRFGHPKGVVASRFMTLCGIEGMYFPFTAEANINTEIPDCSLPSTTCHEMAHQHGFAREDEANYIAYITCNMHPDVDFRYSGTLLALIYSMNALEYSDSEKYKLLSEKYSIGVKRDLSYMRSFWNRFNGPIEEASERLNNAYLKANMQKNGTKSYGRMIDLLLAEQRAQAE